MTAAHPRSRLAACALVALLPLASAGCSVFLVHGPPAAHERLSAFSCTRANVLPVLDAAAAGVALMAGVPLISTGAGDTGGWTTGYAIVGAAFAFDGLVFGASAVSGFGKTSRCREALRRLAERNARTSGAPPR